MTNCKRPSADSEPPGTSGARAPLSPAHQRVLTVASIVMINVDVCSFSRFDPTHTPAVNIVHQIAAKAHATQGMPTVAGS